MELIIESIVDALRDKIAGGGEAVCDKTAGEIVAIFDKAARGVVDWIVAAPSTYKGWLLEVCQRSVEEVEAVRKAAGRAPGAAEVVEYSR